MPLIEEDELRNLHKQIEIQKNNVENIEDDNEELKKHRLILAITSGVLLLLLLAGIITYFASPSTFMDTSKLEENGFKVMSTEEYTQMQEILNAQSTDSFSEEEDVENEYDEDSANEESIEGTKIYAVQVGAFEKGGIELYSSNLIQFTEVRKDDFYKYSLGAFETLPEAQKFRKEIVRLGFKDSFVASYINGKRVRIEEAY